MSNADIDKKLVNRRGVLLAVGRFGSLGLIGGLALLGEAKRRRLLRQGKCVGNGLCAGCGAISGCRLPRALSFKQNVQGAGGAR